MIEIELSGQTYRTGKLDVMRQFHLSRRLAPIIPPLIPVFVKLKAGGLEQDLLGFAGVLGPFADGLSAMSDEDSEYIIGTCLGVVQRKSGKTWAAVWDVGGKVCMFDDMELPDMIQLTLRVIQDNLGPFISGILTSQQGLPTTSTQTG